MNTRRTLLLQYKTRFFLQAGHICGDGYDLIDGRPTGSIRVSMGYMTTYYNVDAVIQLIKSCYCNKERIRFMKKSINGDRRHEKSLNNGEIEKIEVPEWIAGCENIKEVIASIKRRDIWAAIGTLFNEQTDSALYLGPITRTGTENFFLKCYDAAGEWEKEYELSYDEIFRIEFDSRYCTHFNKYMRSKGGNGKAAKSRLTVKS